MPPLTLQPRSHKILLLFPLVAWAPVWAEPAIAPAAPAPAAPHIWSATPDQVNDLCQDAVRRAETGIRAVTSLSAPARTFANTPEAIENALQDLEDAAAPAILLRYVATTSAGRSAGQECQTRVDAFEQKVFFRSDLYRAVVEYDSEHKPLAGERGLLVKKELEDFEMGGADLSAEDRAELSFIRERLGVLETAFAQNIADTRDTMLFAREELAGLPEYVLSRLPQDRGLFRVVATPENYSLVMTLVQDETSRKNMEFLFHNRGAAANSPLLKEMLSLRRSYARLLGHHSYASLLMKDSAEPRPGRMIAALTALARRLRPDALAELQVLSQLQRQPAGPKAKPKITAWDWPYIDFRLRTGLYPSSVDSSSREFFPAGPTIDKTLAVFERMLGIRIQLIGNATAWHPDVRLYALRDSQSADVLAYLYMDLFHREGKSARPLVFTLARGRMRPDGGTQAPACALVADFGAAAPGQPRLLRHEDVEALFHAMGHVLQQAFVRTRYGRFSGPSWPGFAADAVACAFQELAWQPEILTEISGHYRGQVQRLPAAIWRGLVGVRGQGGSLSSLREIAFAIFDLQAHSGSAAGDAARLYERAVKSIALIPITAGTHPASAITALAWHGAQAYYRISSRIIGRQIWRRLLEDGLSNPVGGRHLRDTLLEPGSARPPEESLRMFLGQRPALEAGPADLFRQEAPEQWPSEPDWPAPPLIRARLER